MHSCDADGVAVVVVVVVVVIAVVVVIVVVKGVTRVADTLVLSTVLLICNA